MLPNPCVPNGITGILSSVLPSRRLGIVGRSWFDIKFLLIFVRTLKWEWDCPDIPVPDVVAVVLQFEWTGCGGF